MTPQELRRRREALGLSQSELARRLGVRHSTVWRWEHGRARIPSPVAVALAALAQQAR